MAIVESLPRDIDLTPYVGEWVVLCEDKIIAHSKDLRSIKTEILACKGIPTIVRIPKSNILTF